MAIFISERLSFRLPKLADANFLIQGLGDYDVASNLLVPHPYKIEMAHDWLNKNWQMNTPANSYYIVELNDKTAIGGFGFNQNDGNAVLSYWLIKKYWKQGYAKEAARAIIENYFNITNSKEIFAGAFHFNLASLAIQENLGFTQIGHSMRFCPARNENVKNIETKLTREAFLAAIRK